MKLYLFLLLALFITHSAEGARKKKDKERSNRKPQAKAEEAQETCSCATCERNRNQARPLETPSAIDQAEAGPSSRPDAPTADDTLDPQNNDCPTGRSIRECNIAPGAYRLTETGLHRDPVEPEQVESNEQTTLTRSDSAATIAVDETTTFNTQTPPRRPNFGLATTGNTRTAADDLVRIGIAAANRIRNINQGTTGVRNDLRPLGG